MWRIKNSIRIWLIHLLGGFVHSDLPKLFPDIDWVGRTMKQLSKAAAKTIDNDLMALFKQ